MLEAITSIGLLCYLLYLFVLYFLATWCTLTTVVRS